MTNVRRSGDLYTARELMRVAAPLYVWAEFVGLSIDDVFPTFRLKGEFNPLINHGQTLSDREHPDLEEIYNSASRDPDLKDLAPSVLSFRKNAEAQQIAFGTPTLASLIYQSGYLGYNDFTLCNTLKNKSLNALAQ